MGGHALKSIKTRRYKKDEFEVVKDAILSEIRESVPNKIVVPEYLYEKETFGDLDILIKTSNDRELVSNIIIKHFKPDEVYFSGGNVLSFNYNDLQVDLIFIPDEYFDIAYHYFSWNDLGMLLGKIFNSIHLKYTHEGLKYYIYSEKKGKLLKKVLLSRDIETILSIIDLDYNTYKKGFNNYENIFVFLKKSKYFCYEIFNKKKIRNKDRKRDDVRKSSKLFYNWLENNKDTIKRSTKKFSNTDTINIINKYFPNIDINSIIQDCNTEFNLKRDAKKLFNGNLIMEKIPELNGKILGFYINLFKDSISMDYNLLFEEYVLKNGDIILDKFIAFYGNYKITRIYHENNNSIDNLIKGDSHV